MNVGGKPFFRAFYLLTVLPVHRLMANIYRYFNKAITYKTLTTNTSYHTAPI